MNGPPLGRLERIPLRLVWKSESGDFTPWLGDEANLRLLGETLAMELELETREKDVGPFRADLLCKNTQDGTWTLVENQLEKTDHSHLGQILTYAAGLEATTIIWVAEKFTEEHRAALDWLNLITGERFSFFGVEIELWRIGGSAPAPKFNVVCKPNDWTREVQAQVRTAELTEARQLQLRYWTEFTSYMESRSKIKCQKPQPQHWMNHSIGRSGALMSSIASTWDSENNVSGGENRVELTLNGPESKQWFDRLMTEKEHIESEIGQSLTWYSREGTKANRIYARRPTDIRNTALWPEQFEWLRLNLEKLYKVFEPRVRALPKGIEPALANSPG